MLKVLPNDTNPFEQAYQNHTAPWEIGIPQPAIQALAEAEKIIGDVLDLGCGSGENALLLNARGHMVWGIDISPSAIAEARKKETSDPDNLTFVVGDALKIEVLGEGFHTIIDSGFFHYLSDPEREAYLEGLHHVMFPNSRLFLLCCSDQSKIDWGPRPIRRSELRHLFTAARGFKVEAIQPSHYQLNDHAHDLKAWLAEIRHLQGPHPSSVHHPKRAQ